MRLRFAHLCAAAAIVLVPGSAARVSRTKRATGFVPSDPQAFEVTLSFDNAGRYLAPIGMKNAGNLSLLLSTSSPYTAVAATGCETCAAQVGQAPVYNSSAAKLTGATQSISIGSGEMSGAVIREKCSFNKNKDDGVKWAWDDQTVLMVNNTSGVLGAGVSGFIGLGRSTGNDSYITGILNTQKWKNITFGFAFNSFTSFNGSAANPDAAAQQAAGSFTVREVNTAQFAGEISWQPIQRTSGVPKNTPSDWAIKFDSYRVQFGNQTTTSSGGVAIVEPYFQEIRIPTQEAVDFFNNVPGSQMTNDSSSLSWAVPCDQEHTLSVLIGGNSYRIKKDQLISTDSTGAVCTSLVKGWSDSGVRAYVFGAPFASTAYIAYNAYQDQSGDQIGLAPRSTGNSPAVVNQGVSKGALIGAIVGSVAFSLILFCAILFFFYRRRRASGAPRPQDEGPNEAKIDPFPSGVPNSATPILSTTTRQNGWIIEQGPVGGDPNDGSVLSHERGNMLRSPQSLDSKRLTQSSQLLSMRQSQFTDASVSTPLSATGQPSPSLDHSFHGSRVVSSYGVPESQHEETLPEEEPAPPPYQPGRDETTRANGSSSRRKN